MDKKLKLCLLLGVFFAKISVAQTFIDSLIINNQKIDFENLIRMVDGFYHKSHDCDSLSNGTTVEKRYCLNIRLQREDSLLKKTLNYIIENENDTLFIKK